ncbi:hypothetical protein [Nocardia wallacei]|uniref:hypothetical protein n=1 Tax=Nocardia wallacei TaxID=480035 RepID=UPI0024540A66|nr:hypothetical protein [Nocardia wallacei]
MSDVREALIRAIVRSSMCPGQDYLAAREADALLSEFLIVPRSDIRSWEYGVRSTIGGHVDDSYVSPGRASAAKFVSRRREAQIRLWGSSDAALIRRPILPWMPTAEGAADE